MYHLAEIVSKLYTHSSFFLSALAQTYISMTVQHAVFRAPQTMVTLYIEQEELVNPPTPQHEQQRLSKLGTPLPTHHACRQRYAVPVCLDAVPVAFPPTILRLSTSDRTRRKTMRYLLLFLPQARRP